MADDDPWDWTIDRVVQELCTSTRTWTPRSANALVADPIILETALRREGISGDILLMDFDDAYLKEELDMNMKAWRTFILHAVKKLRERSVQYNAYMQEDEASRGLGANEKALSRVIQGSLQGIIDQAISARESVAGVPQLTSSQIALPSANASLSGRSHLANGETEEPNSKRQKLDAIDASGDNMAVNTIFLQNEVGPAVEDGLLNIEDEPAQFNLEGKKRKRIAPTLITSNIDANRNRDVPTAADELMKNFVPDEDDPEPTPEPQPEPGVIFVGEDGKKRMIPIQSKLTSTEPKAYNDSFRQPGAPASTEQDHLPKPAKTEHIGYLGKKAMPVDNLFYDGVAVGDELESEDETEFGHAPQGLPTGQRRYVNNRMKKFLRAEAKHIVRNGQSYFAVQPYSQALKPRFQKRSFTSYSSRNGQTVALREHDADWPELDAVAKPVQTIIDEHTATFNPLGPGLIEEDAYEGWDPSFLEKYRYLEGGDELLPLYGDSDSDIEYDDQTWKEIQTEKKTNDGPLRKSNKPALSLEKLNEAIDEGISRLVAKWASKVLPKLEKKGWRLWMKSRKRNSKHAQISMAQQVLQHLTERLEKLRAKMLEESYTSSRQVHRQTASMEHTISDRESTLWKIATLKLKRAPEKPAVAVVAAKEPLLSLRNDQEPDGENLESQQEYSSSEDGLDEFLADEEEEDEFMQDEEEQQVHSGSSDEDQILTDGRSASDSPEPIPSIEDVLVSETPHKRSVSSDTLSINGAEASVPLKKESMLPVHRSNRGVSIIDLTRSSDDATPVKSQRKELIDLDTPPPKFILRLKPQLSSQDVSDDDDDTIPRASQADAPVIQKTKGKASKDMEDDSGEEPLSANRRQPRPHLNSEGLQEEVSEDVSDDDFLDDDISQSTKKKYVEDIQAREKRERIQNRRAEQDARRKELHSKLASQGDGNGEENGQIIVNDFATEGHYYLNEYLAKHIKKHQVAGLRFLWGSVVSGSGEVEGSKELDGCLLAHTMGLGKTMQAIALLVSIAESSASDNPLLAEQIPERLRKSKTLVLCPPGLIDNWMDELLSWVRPDDLLGMFWKVNASVPLEERLKCISDWYLSGGVLILGYEMFRNFVMNIATDKRKQPLTAEQHERVMKELVEGPNIVIADEAHKMKNVKAGITKAATLFETKCRIALTGSPLANNIQEYHTMIDWISPNYLGPAREFNAKFVVPIQAGLYQDSTAYERRTARMMLRVLEKDIDAKVQRADMSVLKHDMPPKTEFSITLSLTELQKQAYSRYVTWFLEKAHVKLSKDGDILQSTLWVYLGMLTLLCNHPSLFMTKLREPPKKSKAVVQPKVLEITETDDTPEVDTSEFEISNQVAFQDLVDKEAELFDEIGDVKLMNLSNKVKVLVQILDAAQEAKDKTLVFSHSIPTLDYIENIFKAQRRLYARLDGKTRMADRQKMTKKFNDENNPTNIFIISTTAGGLGLNLPGANRVVIFDFKFNPIEEEQAIGRAYRIGQQKETFVYRLIAGGTFESIVYNTTVFKQQLASRVVDKKAQVPAALKKVSDYLFQPKEVPQEDLYNFVGMDTQVLDKILASQTKESTISTIVQSDNFEREDEALTAEEEALVEKMHQDAKQGKVPPGAANDFKSRINHGGQPMESKGYDRIVNTPQQKMGFGRNGAVEAAPKQAMYMPPQPPAAILPPGIAVGDWNALVTAANLNKSSPPTQLTASHNLPTAESASRSETGATRTSDPIVTPSNTTSNRSRSDTIAINTSRQSPILPPTPIGDSIRSQYSLANSAKFETLSPIKRPKSNRYMTTPKTPSGLPASFGESSTTRSASPLDFHANKRKPKPSQPSDDEEDEEDDLRVGTSQFGQAVKAPYISLSDVQALEKSSIPAETPGESTSGVSAGAPESKAALFIRRAKSYLGSPFAG